MSAVRRSGIIIVAFGLLFSFWITSALAHCGMCGMDEKIVEEETSPLTETLQATVVCLGCTLKKEQGAKAQCSIYGHINALRTKDGKVWTILENDVSGELINSHEYAGEEVEITGKKYRNAQVIEIETLKVLKE